MTLGEDFYRRAVCMHEAGHAVAAAVTGMPFRYVTVHPRHPGAAGLLKFAHPAVRQQAGPDWQARLIVSAAGAIAEDATRRTAGRKLTTASAGMDLKHMQAHARYTWFRAQTGTPLTPVVDPALTVRDIVEHAWRAAAELVRVNLAAVVAVAAALETSGRAVPAVEVRRMVAAQHGPDYDDRCRWVLDRLSVPDPKFWPVRYSRLAWRPMAGAAARLALEAKQKRKLTDV